MHATVHRHGHRQRVHHGDWQARLAQIGCDGVIFDCDGTLVESVVVHGMCLRAGVAEQGYQMDQSWYATRTGLDRASIFQAFQSEFAPDLDVPRAITTSIARFGDHVHLVRPIGAVLELLSTLHTAGYPIAVGTNSEREVAEQSLVHIGVLDKLDALVCISDNVPPKPSPKMFQRAADLMGLNHDRVAVFEDSEQGVAAALAAQMVVFDVGG